MPRQLSKWGLKINPKSLKKTILDPHMSFLLFPSSPRVPTRCQNGPSGTKMDASGLQNHSLGHQKKTTIFCSGNKRRFENSHPEASEPTHISADKFNKSKNHTTKTQQPSRPSNRSEPEVLKQCAIVKHCGEANANPTSLDEG